MSRSVESCVDAVHGPVILGAQGTTLQQLWVVAHGRRPVMLSPEATECIRAAHDRLNRDPGPIYGFHTGVGSLDGCPVAPLDNALHQRSLLRSHAAAVGEPMEAEVVRAMLFVRLAALGRGVSGVSPAFVQSMIAILNAGVVPLVPRLGSVGAADLAPLAHAALVALGESVARVSGDPRWRPAAEVLAEVGLAPLIPTGRDALAWMGGPAQSVASACLLVPRLRRWVEAMVVTTAMTATAMCGRTDAWSAALADAKPHPGSRVVAQRLRHLLGSSSPGTRLRDPLSTRGAHHVLGALTEAVHRLSRVCEIELASVVDNPMLLPDGSWVNNAANFDGSQLAQALDGVVASLAHACAGSERRTACLLDPARSGGLPAFLVHPRARAGVSSGLMLAQYTAAAVVARLRRRSVPAGIGSIPTCAGTEDHVSMVAEAAENAREAFSEARAVAAAELICAAQAVDLRDRPIPPELVNPHRCVRVAAAEWIEDRILSEDLERVGLLIEGGALSADLDDDDPGLARWSYQG